MNTTILAGIVCGFLVLGAAATITAAQQIQTVSEKVPEEEYVVTGVIASQIQTDSRSVEAETSGGAAPGDRKPVITGNVRRVQGDNCLALVTNRGKLDYSVSFSVLGTDTDGREQLKQIYYADLKPKESVEREVRCSTDLNLTLVLNTARAIR